MTPIRSILAATDLSDEGDLVIRAAADLAHTVGATLNVVHVAAPWTKEDAPQHESALEEQVSRILERQSSNAPVEPPSGPPTAGKMDTAVVYDRPYHGILVRAGTVHADLIVVGSHRGGSVGARWSGTTAERIVRSADVPCLVVNRPVSLPFSHVGVGIDFSPSSRGAAALAGEWLPLFSDDDGTPRVSLVHVAPPQSDAEGNLEEEVSRVQGGARGQPPREDVHIEGVLRRSSTPAEELVRWAEEEQPDLLVTSTEAHSGLARVWKGSQATTLAMQAPCPVMIVPPSLWRRSPIPLSKVGLAIDNGDVGRAAREWMTQWSDDKQEPLQLTSIDPDEDLLREARHQKTDLIVVRERRTEPYERIPSHLRTLLEETPIPVLILRDVPDRPIRDVLVAVDTGDIWYEKLGWAKRIVEQFDAHVTIYHAIDLSFSGRIRREPGGEFISGSSAWVDAGVEGEIVPAMKMWLWERARLIGLPLDRVDVRVGLDSPAYAVAAVADKIGTDLVIVAAHAERTPGRARLTRVARATLERGRYNALVVVDRAKRIADWGDPVHPSSRRDRTIEHR